MAREEKREREREETSELPLLINSLREVSDLDTLNMPTKPVRSFF